MPSARLLNYLQENSVDYDLVRHASAYAARDVAHRSGVAQAVFAKTVLVKIDRQPAMVVLPADSRIDLALLQAAAGADEVTLCTGDECQGKCPDCETGAMPPIGPLYDLPVYVAGSLLRSGRIAFNAGTHTEIVAMSFADFRRLVQPRVGHFTTRAGVARQARA